MYKFSTGFCWFYWDWYKDKEVLRDFWTFASGQQLQHSPKDLYVQKRFATYKQEILHHITMDQYRRCYGKAQEYLTTTKIKTMMAAGAGEIQNFGIARFTPIQLDQVLSIILYCDLDRYSTIFSESFRKLKPQDTIYSVRARNSNYWWQSKLFKETIHCYGEQGYQNKDNPGVFYSGVSCLLPIPEFSIHLYAPTSTSVHIEVATNFASSDGMIISFANQQFPAYHSFFFDCSWISRYPDEDERAFVHGNTPIHIECVRIIRSDCTYRSLYAALFMLDSTLSGGFAFLDTNNVLESADTHIIDELFVNEGILSPKDANALTEEQKATVSDLVSSGWTESEALKALSLSKKEKNPALDPYVQAMFRQYIQQKRRINIFIAAFGGIIFSGKVSSSIYSALFETGLQLFSKREIVGYNIPSRVNLLSSNIFKFFPNVKEIIIKASGSPFNLLFFLENISISSKWKQIIISDRADDRHMNQIDWNDIGGWMANLWKYSSFGIIEAYKTKGLTIQFTKTKEKHFHRSQFSQYFERLIIKRM